MARRTVTKEADLERALNAEPNYSTEFTDEVRLLANTLEEVAPGPVEHDADMNYSASQKISVWLNKLCKPVPPRDPKAKYRVVIYVSSKGPFFTFATLKLSPAAEIWKEEVPGQTMHCWVQLGYSDVPGKIKPIQKRITTAMESHGYSLLDESALSRIVEGKSTELDGKPATVFEVLFSEL